MSWGKRWSRRPTPVVDPASTVGTGVSWRWRRLRRGVLITLVPLGVGLFRGPVSSRLGPGWVAGASVDIPEGWRQGLAAIIISRCSGCRPSAHGVMMMSSASMIGRLVVRRASR